MIGGYYDEQTLFKVQTAMQRSGLSTRQVRNVITEMQNDGILFRERDGDMGQVSDGHHTFDELYRYRMLYNAHAARGWLAAGLPVVKSWNHHDGELCFGGGWFVVVATLPSGQVSNHYRQQYWDLFEVPEVELAPEWDGHTPAAAAQRLETALDPAFNPGRVLRSSHGQSEHPAETAVEAGPA